MENPLILLSNELAAAVERAGRRVAAVDGRPRLSSSGLLWRKGVVVTAEHTLRRDEEIRVTLPDGRTVAAEVAGRDPGTDLAVLKADTGEVSDVEWSAPETLRAGNLALAVGRSEAAGINASLGVLSSVSGPWNTWRGGRVDQFLRLDIALYPGASGGVVVDMHGRIAGIATTGLSRTSALAVPGETVNRVAEQLLSKGRIARGFLGLGLQPIPLPEHLKAGPAGLMVLSVEAEGPAARAGVTLGDVVLEMGGRAIAETGDVQEFLSTERVGSAVATTILRGGEKRAVTITIGERGGRSA